MKNDDHMNDVYAQFGDYLPVEQWRRLHQRELQGYLVQRLWPQDGPPKDELARLNAAIDRRDDLLNFVPRVTPVGRVSDGDGFCLFAYGFGPKLVDGTPDTHAIGYDRDVHAQGRSNVATAKRIAELLAAVPRLVVTGQIEVTDALAEKGHRVAESQVAAPVDGVYLNTSGVANRLCPSFSGCRRVWVTSVRSHVARCAATLKAALRANGRTIEVAIPDFVDKIPYAGNDSSQPWTRTEHDYLPHEVLARVKGIVFGAHTIDDLVLFGAERAQ